MTVRAVACVSCLLVLGAAGAESRTGAASAIVFHVRADGTRAVGSGAREERPAIGRVHAPQQSGGDASGASPRSRSRPWWGWLLLGRLHPLVVHFPIGLLSIAAVIEGVHVWRRRPVPSEAGTYCLAFGVAGALVSASLGTINAGHQTITGDAAVTLERHQLMGWIAVVAAAAALGAGQLARRAGRVRIVAAYLGLVFATSAVVGATGHLGGELVYGSEYLTGALPWNQDASESARAGAVTAPAAASRTTPAPLAAHAAPETGAAGQAPAGDVDFARDVMPILEKTCVECHGPDKVKARLRMDSVAGLQKGGKSGALFKAGDAENSLIMRRVLGLDGEDQMPLDKDPLTEAQIDVLRRWIAAGAQFPPASN